MYLLNIDISMGCISMSRNHKRVSQAEQTQEKSRPTKTFKLFKSFKNIEIDRITLQGNEQQMKGKIRFSWNLDQMEDQNSIDLKLKAKRSQSNDDDEIIILEKVQTISAKLKKSDGLVIPTIKFILQDYRQKINNLRFCLWSMLSPLNRKKAKQQFFELALTYPQTYEITIKDIKKEYSLKINKKICFKQYSKDNFFYKLMNQGLRLLKSPTECSYLRLMFSDLFWSIYEEYEETQNEDLTCYRGATLTYAEDQKLMQHEGELIQLEGFISTSLDKEIAQKFKQNALFTIRIPKRRQKIGDFDFGYAKIQKYSFYAGEQEILFNAFNTFKIIKSSEKQKGVRKIELEYYRIAQNNLEKEADQQQDTIRLRKFYEYQEQKLKEIENQGMALFHCGDFQNAHRWFSLKEKKMKQFMLAKTKGEFKYELFKKQSLKKQCQEYREAIEMQAFCKNNLSQYEESKELILRCLQFQKQVFKKDRKYHELLIEYAKILSNLEDKQELLKVLMDILILLDSISQEFKTFAQFRDCKIQIEQKIQQIKQPEKYMFKILQKEEQNLKLLQQTKGTNNVFYITSLKNKLYLQLNIQDWDRIIEDVEKFHKIDPQSPVLSREDKKAILYVIAIAYFSKNQLSQGQSYFKDYRVCFEGQNMIHCQDARMYLQIVEIYYENIHQQIAYPCKNLLSIQPIQSANDSEMEQLRAISNRIIEILKKQLESKLASSLTRFIQGFRIY